MESFSQTMSELNLEDLFASEDDITLPSSTATHISTAILYPSAETISTGLDNKMLSDETVQKMRKRGIAEFEAVQEVGLDGTTGNDTTAAIEKKQRTVSGIDSVIKCIPSGTTAKKGEKVNGTDLAGRKSVSTVTLKKNITGKHSKVKNKAKDLDSNRAAHLERLDIESKVLVLERTFPGIATSAIQRALSESKHNAGIAIGILLEQTFSGDFEARKFEECKIPTGPRKDFRGIQTGPRKDFQGVSSGPRKKWELLENAREKRREAWKKGGKIPRTRKDLGTRGRKVEDANEFQLSKVAMKDRGLSPVRKQKGYWRGDQSALLRKWVVKEASSGGADADEGCWIDIGNFADETGPATTAASGEEKGRGDGNGAAEGNGAVKESIKILGEDTAASGPKREKEKGKGKKTYRGEKRFDKKMWKKHKGSKKPAKKEGGGEKGLRPGVLMIV